MAFFTAKVPVTIATGIICLLAGGGLGAAIMSYAQYDPARAAPAGGGGGEEEAKAGGDKGKGGGGPPGGGMPGGKGGGKGGGGMPGGKGAGAAPIGAGGGGGPRGPSPKVQLAQLVAKLDTLTAQSLHIDLTPEEKKQVKELLSGLAEKDELSDDDATAKLTPLLKLLEGKRKALEDAGFRWPGGGGMGMGGMGGGPPANPFKEGDGAERLKSLQATLGK